MLRNQASKYPGPREGGPAIHLLESPAQNVLGGLPDQNGRNQLPYLRDLHGISPPFGRVKSSSYFRLFGGAYSRRFRKEALITQKVV